MTNVPSKGISGDGAKRFHVFFSYCRDDAPWVEHLAAELEDQFGFRIWLDQWVLVPGSTWIPEIEQGLRTADCCAVFLGKGSPSGWFAQEIQGALAIQVQNPRFRVIPVLIPGCTDNIPMFLELRSWVDFRPGRSHDYSLHVLVSAILGQPPGRWPPRVNTDGNSAGLDNAELRRQWEQIKSSLHESVAIETERKMVAVWLESKGFIS